MNALDRLFNWCAHQPRTRFNWRFYFRLMAMIVFSHSFHDIFISEDNPLVPWKMSWEEHKEVIKFACCFGPIQALLFWHELNVPVKDWLEEINQKMESRMK